MPINKIQPFREDVPSTQDWLNVLELASQLDFERSWQVPPSKLWLQAVLAFTWMFGKRINEILKLKRKNVYFKEGYLHVLFYVGKKKHRTATLNSMPYLKVKTEQHEAMPYLKSYLEDFDKQNRDDPDSYLFPANTKDRILKVHTKFINREGEKETKEYQYTQEGGYIKEENARYWLGQINEKLPKKQRIYFHLGRHTVGTNMARKRKSPYQIAEVLDTTVRTAITYTEHAAGVSEDWTNETE